METSDRERIESKTFQAGTPGSLTVTLRKPGKYYAVLDPGSCCAGAPYDYSFAFAP